MIEYDMSKVDTEKEHQFSRDNWIRELRSGIYSVEGLDCISLEDNGYYLLTLQEIRKDVKEFMLKYPDWTIANGYCTRHTVLVEKRPICLVDISKDNGATSLHTFSGKVLVVVDGDFD